MCLQHDRMLEGCWKTLVTFANYVPLDVSMSEEVEMDWVTMQVMTI